MENIYKTKKLWVNVPETIFEELKRRKLIYHIDNIVVELLLEKYPEILEKKE